MISMGDACINMFVLAKYKCTKSGFAETNFVTTVLQLENPYSSLHDWS